MNFTPHGHEEIGISRRMGMSKGVAPSSGNDVSCSRQLALRSRQPSRVAPYLYFMHIQEDIHFVKTCN